MMNKKLQAIILCTTMLCSMPSLPSESSFASVENNTIYVIDNSNNPRGGDGTQNNPYQSLDYALERAQDGDTIHLKEAIVYVADKHSSKRLEINKAVTIEGSDLSVRVSKGRGIQIGSDVTFRNMNLSIVAEGAQGNIFLAGHKLTLENINNSQAVGQESPIIWAGGDGDTQNGTEAELYVKGNSGGRTKFKQLIAGDPDDDYQGTVNFRLEDPSVSITDIDRKQVVLQQANHRTLGRVNIEVPNATIKSFVDERNDGDNVVNFNFANSFSSGVVLNGVKDVRLARNTVDADAYFMGLRGTLTLENNAKFQVLSPVFDDVHIGDLSFPIITGMGEVNYYLERKLVSDQIDQSVRIRLKKPSGNDLNDYLNKDILVVTSDASENIDIALEEPHPNISIKQNEVRRWQLKNKSQEKLVQLEIGEDDSDFTIANGDVAYTDENSASYLEDLKALKFSADWTQYAISNLEAPERLEEDGNFTGFKWLAKPLGKLVIGQEETTFTKLDTLGTTVTYTVTRPQEGYHYLTKEGEEFPEANYGVAQRLSGESRFSNVELTLEEKSETPNSTHTVTLKYNDNTTADKIISDLSDGATIPNFANENIPERIGYRFAGWFTDDGTFSNSFDAQSEVRANMTLYAKWVKQATLTYDSKGGTSLEAITRDIGTVITLPESNMKTGYEFLGWFDLEEGGEKLTQVDLGEDKTVYAHWSKVADLAILPVKEGDETVKVRVLEGELKADDKILIRISDKEIFYTILPSDIGKAEVEITLPTEVRDILLQGINVTAKVQRGDVTSLNEPKESVQARELSTHTVTLKYNDNTTADKIISDLSDGTTIPNFANENIPERIGYRFAGWFTDDGTFSNSFDAQSEVRANMTLYAKWVKQATLTYDSKGGTSLEAITRDIGTVITLPESSMKTGYEFLGWFDLEEGGEKLTQVDLGEDKTVYAHWSKVADLAILPVKEGDETVKVRVLEGELKADDKIILSTSGVEMIYSVLVSDIVKKELMITLSESLKENLVKGKVLMAKTRRGSIVSLNVASEIVQEKELDSQKPSIPNNQSGSASGGSAVLNSVEKIVDKDKQKDSLYMVNKYKKAYLHGFQDGTIRPNKSLTRAEMVVILHTLLKEDKKESLVSKTIRFKDVKTDAWYSKAVGEMNQLGLIKGKKQDKFAPDDTLSRAEFSVLIYRMLGEPKYEEKSFNDVNVAWMKKSIGYMVGNGYMSGYPDGTFKPNNAITRAEASHVLNQLINKRYMSKLEEQKNLKKFKDNMQKDAWYYEDLLLASNTTNE